jgi:CelD/BcsL family acetyltransferase involved in cellulose biosynthesis
MEYKWYHNLNQFADIADDWNSALLKSNMDLPYLLSDMIIEWWNIFRDNSELCIFVLYDVRRNIVGGMPLYISRLPISKGRFRRMRQIGDDFVNYTQPFYNIDATAFQKYFYLGLSDIKWDYLELPRIRYEFLTQDSRSNLYGDYRILTKHDTNPLIEIVEDAETYIMKRSKRLRTNVRYYRKKAEQIGPVHLEKVIDKVQVDDLANLFIRYSIDSRQSRGGKSTYENPKQAEFVKNIVSVFMQQGKIDVHKLNYGDTIAAVCIGWRYGPGYKYVFTSYNPIYSKISPGYTLIYELINYAFHNKDPYFDMFVGGDVHYKRKWCNKFPTITDLRIFNNHYRGIVSYKILKIKHG